MYSIFIILNDLRKLDEILKVFYANGCGATTVNSEGLAQTLCNHNQNIPIFAGLRSLFENDDPNNVIIMSVIEEEEKLRSIVDTIKPQFDKNRLGIMFVTPVIEAYGVHNKEYKNY